MTLRWDSVVVDSRDVRALASWWAETLGWSVDYEADDEVSIAAPVSVDLTADAAPIRRTPGLVFVPVPDDKSVKNRLHIDLAPGPEDSQADEVRALEERGATRVDVGQADDVSWVVLAAPEGNEFCVLSSRA